MAKALLSILLLVLVGAVAANWMMSAPAQVAVDPSVTSVGMESPVKVNVTSPHGVRRVTAWIEQNGSRHQVFETSEDARRLSLFRSQEAPKAISFTAGKKQAAELKDGPAKLIVEAVANDFAGKSTTVEKALQVNTTPPMISADGHQHYVNQGGMELVTFTAGGYWTEAGVRVGKYTFRSFPLPGGKGENERFAMFAYPWDLGPDVIPVVYARNPSGAEATARFWFKLFPKQFRKRELPLNDQFLQKAVTELDPSGSGPLIDRFLKINGEMRRQNNQTLSDLRLKSEPKILWNGPFFRLGKVESFFADERSYIYQGKKVDQQMHLGFDLSDVQAAPVRAANSGRIVLAEPLGIYGKCVVVDHGYGLQSIYGHMRQIDVKPGDMVKKEQVLGKSGDTGLAGGDHVHFSMQIDGVQINALEWWDPHWIQDRILSKLPGAGQTQQAAAGQH